uniref:HYR domain-containing protein n=1 Tax=Vannella robusta TaxID=1487602 RepID=A0A7S4I4Y4_9EUKA
MVVKILFSVFCFAVLCASTTIVIERPAVDLMVACGPNVEAQYYAFLDDHGEAAANSSCSSSISWYNDAPCDIQTTSCYESIFVVFIATDNCGSYAQTNATFFVIDESPPTVVTPPVDVTIPCDQNTRNEVNAYLISSGGAKFSDYCSSFSITNSFYPISSGESETISFTATDTCGNSVTTQAVLTLAPCY